MCVFRCDKLSNELKLKEVAWAGRETALQKAVEEAKAGTGAANTTENTAQQAGSAFDLIELKGKLTSMEKRNKALEIDVKRCELEVRAKVMVDEKKTQLIDLLDKKLAQEKQKIQKVMNMAEEAIRNKEAMAKKLSQATDQIVDLSKRLTESEKIRGELKVGNQQLRVMLNSIEGKGKKIADLAKEKVRQYDTDNKNLKEEVAKMTREATESKTRISDLQSMLDKNCSKMLEQISALAASSSESWDQQGKADLAEVRQRLADMEEARKLAEAGERQNLLKALEASELLNKELQAEIEVLKILKTQPEQSTQSETKEEKTGAAAAAATGAEDNTAVKPTDVTTVSPTASVTKETDATPGDSQTQTQTDTTPADKSSLSDQVQAQESEMSQMRKEMDAIKALLQQAQLGQAANIANGSKEVSS